MFTPKFFFKKYSDPKPMLRNQNIKEINIIGDNDVQFNSFIKGTNNSFLIKRLTDKFHLRGAESLK